jgi:hypothetical protein
MTTVAAASQHRDLRPICDNRARCALSRVAAEQAGWRSNYPPGCGVATLCSLASIQHAIDARPGNPEFLRDAGKA